MASFLQETLLGTLAAATFLGSPAQADDASRLLQQGEGLFVDGKALRIVIGKAKNDDGTQIKRVNARELGPGVIIFRSGNRLYIADSPPFAPPTVPVAPPTVVASPPSAAPGPAPTTGTAVSPQATTIRPEDMRPNRIRIEYGPPTTPAHQQLYI